jgi:NADH:ubiquinone oxidoreductase subunit C
MNRDDVLARIRSALGDRITDLQQPIDNRLYLKVLPGVIAETARVLSRDFSARFQTASGVDGPREIEILYHWALDSLGMVITVGTRIERADPEIASITPICPAALWIEREMWELLGVCFTGHPDLTHLLLQEEWPQGKYPLRRDYRKG